MTIWQALAHLLNFVYPAVFVAAGLAAVLRWRHGHAWWRSAAVLAGLGVLVLGVGLGFLHRDGAMLTYAAMLALQAAAAAGLARRR